MASYGFGVGLNGMPPQMAQFMPRAYDVVLSPALIVLNTSAEQTFTVNGLNVGDLVLVNKPTSQAGLDVYGFRVTAANTLGITFGNFTGLSITPTAAETYKVIAIKCS